MKLSARAALVLALAASASCSTSSSEPAGPETSISTADLSALVADGFEPVDSFRADLSVAIGTGNEQVAVVGAEAEVEVEAGLIRFLVIEPVEIGAVEEEATEETVVVGDEGWRRPPGEDWESVDESIVSLLFSSFELNEVADVPSALGAFVTAATTGWVGHTERDGTTRYTSADATAGTTSEVLVDAEQRVTEISVVKPPAGVDVDDQRRGLIAMVFSEFDRVTVEVPDDLPS